MNDDAIEEVGASIDGARPLEPEAAGPSGTRALESRPPDPDDPRQPVRELPPDCPVVPLGHRGEVCFFLNPACELIEMKAKDLSRLGILHLFGKENGRLHGYFPSFNSKGDRTGVNYQAASEVLIRDIGRRGVMDPSEKLRGRGAWRGGAGELILHTGDRLFIGPEPKGEAPKRFNAGARGPGELDGYIYPAGSAIGRPEEGDRRPRRTPGSELLDTLKTWNFKRGDTDRRLVLGWVAAAFLSGALDWRPMVWVTGQSGSGKSTLHKLLEGLLLDWLVEASDATAAGLWQKLGRDALPVAVDEIEAEEHNDKAQKVIALARQASSGGLVLRGSSSHVNSQFRIRSAFLFSSILIPPLAAQDRSRIAIVNLMPLPPRAELPDLDPERLHRLGRRLLDHLFRQWGRWQPTFKVYRDALLDTGHKARAADQFGTLLAAADLASESDMTGISTMAELMADELSPDNLGETLDGNEAGALSWMLGSMVEIGRERATLGQFLQKAYDAKNNTPDLHGNAFPDDQDTFNRLNPGLAANGVRVLETKEGSADGTARLMIAIAKEHRGLSRLFENSHWPGKAGAEGVWTQALGRLPGAIMSQNPVRFAGPRSRAVLLPPELCVEVQTKPGSDG